MNDKLLLQECDHILWEGGYSYNVTEKLERIIAKVQDDMALMHAIELMEAVEQERAKTIEACLAAVREQGVHHENVDHDAYTSGRIQQHGKDLKAIKGVGDE